MVPQIKTRKKHKDKKPIYFLLAAIVVFGLFIYLITRPSTQSKAVKELETSFNKKDIEMVWYKYKADLYQNEDFLYKIRERLTSFELTKEEVNECKGWLPPAPVSLNIIVVPDLSRRIIDTINNPNQIASDIAVLNTIWDTFKASTKSKHDAKDKLSIDVTDINQAKGQFDKVANKLQFDLSEFKGKSNILYFTENVDKQFADNVKDMYTSATQMPLGADYRFYLRRYLANHLKENTLFDNFNNKVIMITDGYLEAENSIPDTKIYGYQKELYAAVHFGNVAQTINSNHLNIPKVDIDLSNTEILVCEVNERKVGKGYDFEVLDAYWSDWMKRMGVKKFKFLEREQASELTKKSIQSFIND